MGFCEKLEISLLHTVLENVVVRNFRFKFFIKQCTSVQTLNNAPEELVKGKDLSSICSMVSTVMATLTAQSVTNEILLTNFVEMQARFMLNTEREAHEFRIASGKELAKKAVLHSQIIIQYPLNDDDAALFKKQCGDKNNDRDKQMLLARATIWLQDLNKQKILTSFDFKNVYNAHLSERQKKNLP